MFNIDWSYIFRELGLTEKCDRAKFFLLGEECKGYRRLGIAAMLLLVAFTVFVVKNWPTGPDLVP